VPLPETQSGNRRGFSPFVARSLLAMGVMQAPGYRTNPRHQIREIPVAETVRVILRGETVAESKNTIRVEEDGHPARSYFPRADVRIDLLERTRTETHCPFKGTASYFTLNDGKGNVGANRLTDALWSYEEPYDEHIGLKGRLAFYEENFPELEIRTGD
jgi:uncharacterized protein (DUF427 family)